MAITENTYTGDGSTVLFSFTFPYLDQSHVKVSLNGSDTTAFTFANATTIQMNSAPSVGVAIRIYRNSDSDNVEATFFPGSSIRAGDLNDNFLQALYLNQETIRIAQEATLGGIADGSIGTVKYADNSITNDKVSPTAGIVDTKLATISTAGKVANSATTATSANTASAIVARDANGNFNTTSINSGPLAGFRNAIINGNFDVWQRGTSAAAFGYATADRWTTRSSGGTGGSVTQSRQAFTMGQTEVSGEPTWFWRHVYTSTTGIPFAEQRIEGVRTFAGQVVTVSFWAKRSVSSSTCNVELVQSFGTGGSPSTAVSTASSNLTVGTNWTYLTTTITLPSIAGKTLGSDGNDSLLLRINMGGTGSFTFELAQVQVELGPVATPFECRPIGTELALCQRYLTRWGASTRICTGARGVVNSTYRAATTLPVALRGSGTLTWNDVTSTQATTVTAVTSFNSFVAIGNTLSFDAVVATTGLDATMIATGASGFFQIDAEL